MLKNNKTRVNDNEYLILGTARLNDLEDVLDLPQADNEDDYDSISGLIINYLERLPQAGDEVEFDGLRLVVEECDNNRITKVHAYIIPKEEDEGE